MKSNNLFSLFSSYLFFLILILIITSDPTQILFKSNQTFFFFNFARMLCLFVFHNYFKSITINYSLHLHFCLIFCLQKQIDCPTLTQPLFQESFSTFSSSFSSSCVFNWLCLFFSFQLPLAFFRLPDLPGLLGLLSSATHQQGKTIWLCCSAFDSFKNAQSTQMCRMVTVARQQQHHFSFVLPLLLKHLVCNLNI